MKVLYVTDIHGVKWKYDRIYEIASESNVDIVINGGDMLPTRPNFFIQDIFIETFLKEQFQAFDSEGIYYLFMPGNDDLIIHDDLLEDSSDEFKFVHNIAQKKYEVNKYEFIGMNWVTDFPFGLKDRARMDTNSFNFPKPIGKPILSTENGVKPIDDWFSYARSLPTIKEELKTLPVPENLDKSIYVIHSPPTNLSLDVCSDKSEVGSKAVYDFLKQWQPLLSLHGHIHESPAISNVWYNKIGNTVCIQPGQTDIHERYMFYVLIELETMDIERRILEK